MIYICDRNSNQKYLFKKEVNQKGLCHDMDRVFLFMMFKCRADKGWGCFSLNVSKISLILLRDKKIVCGLFEIHADKLCLSAFNFIS